MFRNSISRYTIVAIGLHWAIAALILFMIWLGWNMEDNETRYQLHKSVGITILILTVARIIWRVMNPPPALPSRMRPLEKRASHFVHIGLYALMVLMPLLGWAIVSTTDFRVPTVLYGTVSWPELPFLSGLRGNKPVHQVLEFLHSKGAWVIIALLVLHVGGALKHEFSPDEGVLKRMFPFFFGKTQPPRQPARGFLVAFGGAALLFAAIAGAPLIGQALSPSPSMRQLPPSNALPAPVTDAPIAANWDVDYARSEIRFSGVHDGKEFSGTFSGWTANVAFYPDNLVDSHVEVTIPTGSGKTGKKLYNDSLRAPEWFDISNYPVATATLSDFAATASGYTATATLQLKKSRAKVPLDFTLVIKDDVATLTGEAVFSRKSLNLGQISDPEASWVSDNVTVTVTGQATRKPVP
ncbi:cytochrome b/b6 domain-containing protein [Hyphomonas johnsonii]|uniref:Nickel-dependent hydrogenase, b-type cytochrome subunit/YceI-like family protein n=1 Tax=Hyphomonas johnsonii MHS-2 TaxID=1280950 RepID=A0A059FG19_9PROT|nr:cytochrome b/b6 domain-containing protein [Hyphomonas johnsonii]KCZ89496.1 nickel-dependent hydrogenase, b-type cytochrome subunit/YceI-like family protein [Hyphomonas johnsonii MHS-2]